MNDARPVTDPNLVIVLDELSSDRALRAQAGLLLSGHGERAAKRLEDWAEQLVESGEVSDRFAWSVLTIEQWQEVADALREGRIVEYPAVDVGSADALEAGYRTLAADAAKCAPCGTHPAEHRAAVINEMQRAIQRSALAATHPYGLVACPVCTLGAIDAAAQRAQRIAAHGESLLFALKDAIATLEGRVPETTREDWHELIDDCERGDGARS